MSRLAGRGTGEELPEGLTQATLSVDRRLEDQHGRHLVDDLAVGPSWQSAGMQATVSIYRREPFVHEADRRVGKLWPGVEPRP